MAGECPGAFLSHTDVLAMAWELQPRGMAGKAWQHLGQRHAYNALFLDYNTSRNA